MNPNYATNLVRNGQGFSPVVFKTDANGNPISSTGAAAKVRRRVLRSLQDRPVAEVRVLQHRQRVQRDHGRAARGRRAPHRRHHHRRLHPRRAAAHPERRQRVPGLGRALVRDGDRLARASPRVLEQVLRLGQAHRRVHLRRLQHQHAAPGHGEPVPGLPLHPRVHRHDGVHGRSGLRQRLRPREGSAQRLRQVPGPAHAARRAQRPGAARGGLEPAAQLQGQVHLRPGQPEHQQSQGRLHRSVLAASSARSRSSPPTSSRSSPGTSTATGRRTAGTARRRPASSRRGRSGTPHAPASPTPSAECSLDTRWSTSTRTCSGIRRAASTT